MSQSKSKKKVVVSSASDEIKKSTRSSFLTDSKESSENLFGRKNFLIMLVGIVLIGLGMLLMSGGAMPSPEVWDESIIYSKRRTLLAPIVILIGLGLQVYAIFAKK